MTQATGGVTDLQALVKKLVAAGGTKLVLIRI